MIIQITININKILEQVNNLWYINSINYPTSETKLLYYSYIKQHGWIKIELTKNNEEYISLRCIPNETGYF